MCHFYQSKDIMNEKDIIFKGKIPKMKKEGFQRLTKIFI